MKKIIYTVCSINHLAYAKTMADSFMKYHNEYNVIIGLVDEVQERFDKSYFIPYLLIEAGNIEINQFRKMASQYSVFELVCAMKPFFALYIFEKYQPEILIYLDSDIWVKNNFSLIECSLEVNDILITPHFTHPLPDSDKIPRERDLLRSGLYNAGFLAMKKSLAATNFLNWWKFHMIDECYLDFSQGMFVDQIWLNLLPLFEKNVGVFNNLGANVAYWNLHERTLDIIDNVVFVNHSDPLLFLHISGYNLNEPHFLSKHQNRFELKKLPVLLELLEEYRNELFSNGYSTYSKMLCVYGKSAKKSTGLMSILNKLIRPFGIKISGLK